MHSARRVRGFDIPCSTLSSDPRLLSTSQFLPSVSGQDVSGSTGWPSIVELDPVCPDGRTDRAERQDGQQCLACYPSPPPHLPWRPQRKAYLANFLTVVFDHPASCSPSGKLLCLARSLLLHLECVSRLFCPVPCYCVAYNHSNHLQLCTS